MLPQASLPSSARRCNRLPAPMGSELRAGAGHVEPLAVAAVDDAVALPHVLAELVDRHELPAAEGRGELREEPGGVLGQLQTVRAVEHEGRNLAAVVEPELHDDVEALIDELAQGGVAASEGGVVAALRLLVSGDELVPDDPEVHED